ncbi:hypothetical protein [Arthrobacter sp. H5]|uniref:hypothetical protein n=1 Tax=Arthrobacter sp. H5 TaxID=1267973 RepID=UPI00048557B3|nr:hypothetical protein [Arthrobacter sp. H5]
MLEPDGVCPAGNEISQQDESSDGTSASQSQLVVLPDSPDTRLLVSLTSHANDLSEAAHSLGRALDSGEGSEVWEPLTSHAVTSYIRPFIHSNVRVRLDQMPEFPGIPLELLATHDMIRRYRNTTVAHSQSDLVMPLPVALLGEADRVVRVWGMSVVHPMPAAVAVRFADLLMTMETIVDDATQPVIERLRTWVQTQPAATVRRWPGPEVTHSTDDDFNSSRRRSRIPRFTAYLHVEQVQDDTHFPE